MVNNRYENGIIFSVLMLSTVLVGMTMLTAVALAAPVSTIVVTASNPSPQVNQTISIIATAMDNGSISSSLNGTMQFLANGISFGSAPIISGIAGTTFTTATPGTVTIIAEFNGTQGSTTVVFIEPALSLSANPTTVTVGTATNVVFTVSPALSGATVILSGAVVSISGTTDASGSATISVNATGAGTITATASMSGYTSGTKNITAGLPALTVSANPKNVTVGTATNVIFTVSPALSGATVTLTDKATGSGTIDASGSVTISVNATGTGTITATASMSGYTNGIANITAGLPALTVSTNTSLVTVGNVTNVTFTVSPALSGATVTLTDKATGTGTIDASGSVTISVNATGAGTITVTASMTGYTSGKTMVTAGLPALTVSANPKNVTVGTPTNVIFTVSPALSGATVTLTDKATGSGTTDANGSVNISVNATGAGTITVTPGMTGYTGVPIFLAAIIAIDITPPESITNLTMVNNGTSWIEWNWTNPIADFSYVAIWINNGWHNASVGANLFNTSGILSLLPGTEYTIATHTVDASGNVNSTWITLNSSTLPNTPVSTSPINLTLSLGSLVTFPNVTVAGNTVEANDDGGHPLSASYILAGAYHNISTTANYSTPVTVSVKYTLPTGYKDSDVRLYHWNYLTGQWENVTISSGSGMVTGLVSSLSPFVPAIPAKPSITKKDPTGASNESIVTQPMTFNITVDQTANVTWSIDSNPVTNTSNYPANTVISYTKTPSLVGNYNVSVSASNSNGTDTEYWNWSVHSTTYFTGNRIWDGSKPLEFSKTYYWTPQSFSGFYYNAKDDVGTEKLTMTLGDYSSRTIATGALVYSTSPQDVSFTHSAWGTYQVIGFMADKYFAGYTANTSSTNTRPTTDFNGISSLAQGGLHRVLIDDDTKRTIAVGGTYALQDGYVLKAKDIDLNARTMLLSLLKDGAEVDVSPLAAGETYVYTKTVGGVESLPLIMVRFDNVFSGSELQVAFMKGVFQISEDVTTVHTGDQFSNMKISFVDKNVIQMKNSNNIALTKGTTADIMGDLKILVANNDSVVRFALTVDRPSNLEVRSTVYRDSDSPPVTEWTPYNFGMNIGSTSVGFFYDLDDGVGSEKLTLGAPVSGRTIPENGLVYSTSPQEVKFTYTGFGKYQAIGFMADNYFAGYTSNTGISNGIPLLTRPTTDFSGISTISHGSLHKVLIDDDTKRTISVGGTIALQEGYVLKATDIDLNARTMLISLLKDGAEVDVSPLAAGETYVYTKTVGGTESLPLIMVRFESVFSGNELQVAFLRGIFQISDNPTTIQVGNQFGNMKVTSVSSNSITMSNSNTIGLSKNTDNALMGDIRLRIADNDALRFYFAVDVTPEIIANQLVIDAPAKATAGDTIQIKVTAKSVGIANANVNIGTDSGTADKNGIFNYTIPRSLVGTYSINATMTGYDKATKNIVIDKYIDYTLSIQAPSQANQLETITVKVLYNGTAMSGATVSFDNATVGTTDSNGEVAYKLDTSGTHNISASKKSYLSVSRDIEIRALYSEFKAVDINITPSQGFIGEAYLVRSNITNVGTKGDSTLVELIVNSTSVNNKTVTVDAGGKVEVNFTRIETVAGNVTVEIMGQSMIYEAKVNPTNWPLIVVVATVIGAIAIYIATSKGLINLELLKQKFNTLFKKGE
ncbi:MAG: S-layer protein domain-containing protein [Candidatus Methanoperedens sp.]|nr:S-layer protein domain-containing protein [Candidatus Methanoperedens sp.]